jgi:hypothetical protein
MASLTVTVRTRGTRRAICPLRLTALLVQMRRFQLATRVARSIGVRMKIGYGKHAQWSWVPLAKPVIQQMEAMDDGE